MSTAHWHVTTTDVYHFESNRQAPEVIGTFATRDDALAALDVIAGALAALNYSVNAETSAELTRSVERRIFADIVEHADLGAYACDRRKCAA